jgi:hypothetical protein
MTTGIEWETVKSVTGTASLIAFGAAAIASVLRQWIRSRERLVRLTPEKYRPRLVDRALGLSPIPVSDLARKDRRDLFLVHLKFRERQLLYILGFLLLIAGGASITFLVARRADAAPRPTLEALVLEQWKEDQGEFLKQHGLPADDRRINVWFQFFAKGVILYDVPDGVSWILKLSSGQFIRVTNPEVLVSEHHREEINWQLFDELADTAKITLADRAAYRELFREKKIIGGIGTLFLRHALLKEIGPPQDMPNTLRGVHTEDFMEDILYSSGPQYELLVGLPNRAADDPTNRRTRAVIALFRDGSYRKFTVNLNQARRVLARDPTSGG